MEKKIRNVIFDFGGVIVNLSIAATVEAFRQLGADTEGFLGKYGQQGIFRELELGRMTPEEFCQQLLPGKAPEEIYAAWNSMLTDIPLRRLQALRGLKERYHISLLSNTNDIHWQYSLQQHFLAQGFDPYQEFEHVFLSQEMHLAKPEKGIFEEVLRQTGYAPEETLFVDDSEENCKAFAELGVQTFTPRHGDDWLGELCPSVASIGFFDGVHRGHRHLIRQVESAAKQRDMDAMLITFCRHPREVVQPDYIPQLLTSTREKVQLLEQADIQRLEVLNFDHEMSQLSAKDFMRQVLRDQLGVKVLVMGYDHHFGHGGGEMEDYIRWGEEVGIEVLRAEELPQDYVSSSECRRKLMAGEVEEAARLLGHPYLLTGQVGEGHHIGQKLGFPTANVILERGKVLPAHGVYAVKVRMESASGQTHEYAGMLNIGTRPTMENGEDTSIEVNILNFEGDLYGKTIQLEFLKRLRDERKFSSFQELQEQLGKDREQVISIGNKG